MATLWALISLSVAGSLFTLLMTQDSSDLSQKFFGLVPNPSYPHLVSVKSLQCLLYDVCVCILGDVSQGLCLPLICLLWPSEAHNRVSMNGYWVNEDYTMPSTIFHALKDPIPES